MKNNHCLFILSLIALLTLGCKSSKETSASSTGVWVNKEKLKDKSFKSVFIVVMTADIQARLQLENDLAAVAAKRGYKFVKSSDVLPTDLKNPKLPEKDDVIAKVEASGCDAVFVASLLRKEEDVHYTPGQTTYSLQPYNTYYPGYYSHWAPAVSEPDYFAHEKNFFMQSNLYDVASREVMWSVQSTVFSPDNLKGFSKSYTTTLVKQLEKAHAIKK
jgi:hypothetical protein